MRILKGAVATMLLTLAAHSVAVAEENVGGYNVINVPVNSDVVLSPSFNQAVQASYTVSAKSGSTVITIADTMTSGAYANAYYVRFTSGAASGLWSTITANTVTDLTIGADVQALAAVGDTFRVYKHHTLASMFPKSMLGVSYISGTIVLIYDNATPAIKQNRQPAKIASFTTAAGGLWTGAGVNNSTILPPETMFILRNPSSSTQALTMVLTGVAADYSPAVLVTPSNDINVGSGSPMTVQLKEAGMGGVTGRNALLYDNAPVKQNKQPAKIAQYNTASGGIWVGSGVTGFEPVGAGQGFVLRTPAGEVAGTKITFKKPY